MTTFSSELINAYQEGRLLHVMQGKHRENFKEPDPLFDEIVSLHNNGDIDVVESFKKLRNTPDLGLDFFSARRIFEKILSRLVAPVLPVMECVVQLVREAGRDMAAGMLLPPFTDYCKASPERIPEAIQHIENDIQQFADLLPIVILAGSEIDLQRYCDEAIRLAGHSEILLRSQAIFSLGRIQYSDNTSIIDNTITALEQALEQETDGRLLGSLLKSTVSLSRSRLDQEKRLIKLINRSMQGGDDFTLHVAAEALYIYGNEISATVMDTLLLWLREVNLENKGTLREIDFALSNLLETPQKEKILTFIEQFLIKHGNLFSLETFENTSHYLGENNEYFNKLFTKWFSNGDHSLCRAARKILEKTPKEYLEVDFSLLEGIPSSPQLIFIARKAVGNLFYSFSKAAASIIVSLIKYIPTNDLETENTLGRLLYSPLFVSYPQEIEEYLQKVAKSKNEREKRVAETVLATGTQYLQDVTATGNIPELHPPESHKEVHYRKMSTIMSEAMKEAEKESIFLSLVSKSVLLYGRSSIHYVYDANGQSNRREIPLVTHSTGITIPRLEILDPLGLDYMLRVFQIEQLKNETNN